MGDYADVIGDGIRTIGCAVLIAVTVGTVVAFAVGVAMGALLF